MFYFLQRCIQKFGVFNGLRIYWQLKVIKQGVFSLPDLDQPTYLRQKTIDLHTFREIFLREEYDLQNYSMLTPQYIIDAGANIGFTSLYFHRQYPLAQIVSLEPDSGNYQYLAKNTSSIPSIKPLQKALWHTNGPVELQDEGHGFRGFTITEKKDVSTVTSTMEGITIDSLMSLCNFPHIDILKIDIEGSEKEIFTAGYDKWLPLTRCLVIELHDRMKPGCSKAVFSAISNYTFEFSIKGENLVFINKCLKVQNL